MFKIAILMLMCMFSTITRADTIDFSGYTWNVWITEDATQGMIAKSKSSAWVDEEGKLHLVADAVRAGCLAVEVATVNTFGDGAYSFDVAIPDVMNNWHKNLVLEVSSSDAGDNGEEATQNIEIMLSQMGDALRKEMLSYSYLPKDSEIGQITRSLALSLDKGYVFKYTRSTISGVPGIKFETKSNDGQVVSWAARTMKRNPVAKRMPVSIKLGCFEAGSIGGPVEIVINSFKHEAFVDNSN